MDGSTKTQWHGYVLFLFLLTVITACAPSSDSTSDRHSEIVIAATANAGPIQSGIVTEPVILNGSNSEGTDGIYHWTLRSVPAGSEARLAGFDTAQPYFFPDRAGTYVVQLVVINVAGDTSKDFVTVTVTDRATTSISATAEFHQGISQSCVTCHDGTQATGKPAMHIAATDECAVCHGVDAWLPNIAIDHNEILGTCSFCHNGTRAPGKPEGHIETKAECVECHTAGTTFSLVYSKELLFNTRSLHSGSSSSTSSSDDHPPIGAMMCIDCHNNMIEEGKPADHIPSSDNCENCHTTDEWDIAPAGATPPISIIDDHPPMGGLMCVDCHNNMIEEGKPADHIPSSDNCQNCHTTEDWDINGSGSSDDEHPPIGDMMCIDCHNNVIQEGKPADHIPSSDMCQNCHNTDDWDDVAGGGSGSRDDDVSDEEEEDHPPIGNMMCFDCHNNIIEEGKEDDHILTTNMCEACHTTNDWEPVTTVDHAEVIGICSSCHNNMIAMGKPPGHVVTTSECNVCHSTVAW